MATCLCNPRANAVEPSSNPTPLRVMAANLTTGKQSYDPGEGIRIFKGLKPDIVLIQEFNYGDNSDSDIGSFVSSTFGSDYHYFKEPKDSKDITIPNGVISRWPILKAGKWNDPRTKDREFVFAQIDIPGPKDLWAISVHLLNKGTAKTRNAQAEDLLQNISKVIPENDFLVLGGDFNTTTGSELALQTLGSVFDLTAVPADQSGNTNTNHNRDKHYDWVLPDKDLFQYHMPVRIGANTFPSGLVFDSRSYTHLADVTPILESDCVPKQMQHMAVVKDFLVPTH